MPKREVSFHRFIREFQDAAHTRRDARETLDALLLSLAALAGFALDDMTQDDGWRLMMVGRRLERLTSSRLACRVCGSSSAPMTRPLKPNTLR